MSSFFMVFFTVTSNYQRTRCFLSRPIRKMYMRNSVVEQSECHARRLDFGSFYIYLIFCSICILYIRICVFFLNNVKSGRVPFVLCRIPDKQFYFCSFSDCFPCFMGFFFKLKVIVIFSNT